MKVIAMLCGFFFFSLSYGQTDRMTFERKVYSAIGEMGPVYPDRSYLDSIAVNHERIDIYFYQKHFDLHCALPPMLVDTAYKNSGYSEPGGRHTYPRVPVASAGSSPDTTKIVYDLVGPSKFYFDSLSMYRWHYDYDFDSLSRIIHYSYSSCLACNLQSYDYYVKYNPAGQMECISNMQLSIIKDLMISEDTPVLKLCYNDAGDLIRVDYYSDHLLSKTIKWLK